MLGLLKPQHSVFYDIIYQQASNNTRTKAIGLSYVNINLLVKLFKKLILIDQQDHGLNSWKIYL